MKTVKLRDSAKAGVERFHNEFDKLRDALKKKSVLGINYFSLIIHKRQIILPRYIDFESTWPNQSKFFVKSIVLTQLLKSVKNAKRSRC